MARNIPNYHNEKDSPFFGLRSKAQLANYLFISVAKLKKFSSGGEYYYSFTKQKKSGGVRKIDAPRDDLKAIQSRIADLLQRITPPDYLFAPVAGRSYVDNAARHIGARSVRLLDIEDFFPSCTANKVIWFFKTRMNCSSDVAVILKNIVTKDGALPQGSPCSPILAYLCYVDMWEEIEKIVDDEKCRLSVYADDLTISGKVVPEKIIWRIKQTLHRHGHRYNLSKERSRFNQPSEVTGVILTREKLLAPNRQNQKIYNLRRELAATRSQEKRDKLQAQLKGREAQIRQVTGNLETKNM